MISLGQVGVRPHAAIGVAPPEIIGAVDWASRSWLRQGPLQILQAGLQMQGEGDFAGGGVMPFTVRSNSVVALLRTIFVPSALRTPPATLYTFLFSSVRWW